MITELEIGCRIPADECWRAVSERDSRADGAFVYAVRSTGIFCRPTCPSRRPRRENVEFFSTTVAAARAGFRACKRCRPLEASAQLRLARDTCRFIDEHLDEPIDLNRLSASAGVSRSQLLRA